MIGDVIGMFPFQSAPPPRLVWTAVTIGSQAMPTKKNQNPKSESGERLKIKSEVLLNAFEKFFALREIFTKYPETDTY